MFLNTDFEIYGSSHADDGGGDGDCDDVFDDGRGDDDDGRRLGVETERSGVPHRESKPSAHRHRTARTTRQINGANSSEARAI